MRTTTRVHTPEERRQMRMQAEHRARTCQVQLLCMVSMVRTAVCRVIPLCGSAGWWVVPVCMLPGCLVYGLSALAVKRSDAATLQDAMGKRWGKPGVWLLGIVLGALLLLDGAATMTALVIMFTEGIGTEGTQVTMALTTLGALTLCLHRDGLSWGIWLMRRGMLLTGLVIAAVLAGMGSVDMLYPPLGRGEESVTAAIGAGISMGWPLVLLGTVEKPQTGRGKPLLLPVGVTAAAALLVCWSNPCETLVQGRILAQRVLLPVWHLPPALRTVAHGLMMLAALLTIASCAQLAAKQLLRPSGRELVWMPYLLGAVMAGWMFLPGDAVWRGLNGVLAWGLLPLAVLIPGMNRRRKTK